MLMGIRPAESWSSLASTSSPPTAPRLPPAFFSFQITNGAADMSLAPTAGSGPPVKHTAQYSLTNGARCKETRTVPAIGPITIAQARGS
jgi:hypothetical protein